MIRGITRRHFANSSTWPGLAPHKNNSVVIRLSFLWNMSLAPQMLLTIFKRKIILWQALQNALVFAMRCFFKVLQNFAVSCAVATGPPTRVKRLFLKQKPSPSHLSEQREECHQAATDHQINLAKAKLVNPGSDP